MLGLGLTGAVAWSGSAAAQGWTACANEGQMCEFAGVKQVRYGAGNQYVYRVETDGVRCSNDVFGDPAFGQRKSCEVYETAAAAQGTSGGGEDLRTQIQMRDARIAELENALRERDQRVADLQTRLRDVRGRLQNLRARIREMR
jgi:hypothetical protein